MKSKLGYKKGSPYLNEEEIVINSNHITTEDMAFPIMANGIPLFPDTGDYIFEGTNKVVEKPIMQQGSFFSSMKDEMNKADLGMDDIFYSFDKLSNLGKDFKFGDDLNAARKTDSKKFNPDFIPALGIGNAALNKFSEFMKRKELEKEYMRMQTLSNIPETTKLTDTGRYGNPYIMQQGGVSPELMTDWNNYLDYLDSKGVRGKADLDKNNTGFKYLEDYIKENPNTRLKRDSIPVIQNYLQDYRGWVIDQHKAGKVQLKESPAPDYSNFMPFISSYEAQGRKWGDGYPGQYTTSVRFPSEYLNSKRVGFAKKYQLGGIGSYDLSSETVSPSFDFNISQPTIEKLPNIETENTSAPASSDFKQAIIMKESAGNYKALPKKKDGTLASSAVGAYQFLWNKHKDEIKKITGVTSKEEFRNNPKAQDTYFDYWDATVLTPTAMTIQKVLGNNSPDINDIKAKVHFAGPGGAKKYFFKGVETKDAFGTTTSSYKINKKFKEGGEYEMNPEQLLQFLKHGGEVEYIIE